MMHGREKSDSSDVPAARRRCGVGGLCPQKSRQKREPRFKAGLEVNGVRHLKSPASLAA
jgi:hypothetical protein